MTDAPQMPEGWHIGKTNRQSEPMFVYSSGSVSLTQLRALLATQGLTIVRSDDVRLTFLDVNDIAEWLGAPERNLHVVSAKDMAVLDGVTRLVVEWIEQGSVGQEDPDVSMQQIEALLGERVQAELARRKP